MGSIFSNTIKRITNDDILRKEDDIVYYEGSHGIQQDIRDGEYEGFEYHIKTFGKYPTIEVCHKELFFQGSIHKNAYEMKDRNGQPFKVNCCLVFFTGSLEDEVSYTHQYNEKDDLILGGHPGHKYTIQELEADCKAVIDQVKDM